MNFRCVLIVALFVALAAGRHRPASGDDRIGYNRDIRPILAENCFQCHGPDSAQRQADLRVDQREQVVERGMLVPGDADSSELIRRIFSDDAAELMPPPDSHKQLTDDQKQLLRRWIDQGAEYEPHWSFIPITRPELPAVKQEAWVRNGLDRFILAELERAGLEPAPEADRRTLARRLSLDLTGLPPEPADVEAFVNDSAPDAYEQYVDRLLASQQWGEHRARHWLDVARYADTHGIHFDNFREMWSYRDWVIKAFNANLPFDQFTIQQLAGDLLPQPTLDQRIASGFNRCNITTNEGGIIDEEYLVLYTRDRTETTAQVWLGLTTGCAVCHDHKFDPLSQREFYQLAAFFNNTTQAAKDGNVQNTPPIIVVPTDDDRPDWLRLEAQSADLLARLEERRGSARPQFDAWLPESRVDRVLAQLSTAALETHALVAEGAAGSIAFLHQGQLRWLPLDGKMEFDAGHVAPRAMKITEQSSLTLADAGNFQRDEAFTAAAWVRVPQANQTGSIVARIDERNKYRGWELSLENGRLAAQLIHEHPGKSLKVSIREPFPTGGWRHVALVYDGSGKAAGLKLFVNGQMQTTLTRSETLDDSILCDAPLAIGQRPSGKMRLTGMAIQDVRLYRRAVPQRELNQVMETTRAARLAGLPADQRKLEHVDQLYGWWLAELDAPYGELLAQQHQVQHEQDQIKARGTIAHVMQERAEKPTAFVLFRGEYDQRRDQVDAATPSMLPPMPEDLPRNRLGFAQWLLRPENPLTTRVTVNRFWQEVFGTGLVRTTGDFGIAGELPSHPELLDWLAVELRDGGWDIKQFFKLLVTSATYRQSAAVTPEKLEKDSHNRLLSRGPRFRMDAEMLRDYALAASGLLVAKIGGPSVKPYQPEGVWEAVAMIGSNTRSYQQDSGENLYRRSMYTFWKRAAPPASMEVFNAPNREVCTVRRERTNTPLQALVTMNDPQFVEAARCLAERTLRDTSSEPIERAQYMAARVLARPLDNAELDVVLNTAESLLAWYAERADDARQLIAVGASTPDNRLPAPELAAWTMVANQLLNLDEVLCK